MGKLDKFAEERRKQDSDSKKEANRNRLKLALKKRMTTIMVGAIDEFERAFGEFWGHAINSDDKTDDELDLFALWTRCRNKIFDRGNKEIRAVEKEIDKCDIEFSRYEYIFKLKAKDKGTKNEEES